MKEKNVNVKEKKQEETVVYVIGWCLIAVLLAALLIQHWGPEQIRWLDSSCLFWKLTGFYCPGCGGTRAFLALKNGRVLSSVVYHPFVLYGVVTGGWYMISQTVERLTKRKAAIGMRYRDCYLWIALILIVANCALKNVLLLLGVDVLQIAAGL